MVGFARIMPFILGAAISPVLLITVLYILSRPQKPVLKSLLYLLGATICISTITALIFLTATNVTIKSSKPSLLPHLIIGALVLFLAFDIFRKGPQRSRHKEAQSDGLVKYFVVGVALMLVNFTTIAMIFEVALEIRALSVPIADRNIYFFATILASLVPILLPLLVLAISGKHSKQILAVLSGFMKKYSYLVTSAFFALIGVYILIKALIG